MMIPRVSCGAACLMFLAAISSNVSADDGPSQPLANGAKAVNFELPVVGSKNFIELQEEYKKGPVVVIVLRGYPGYQCPLCSKQVNSLANRAKALAQEASRVILVYPGEASLLQRHAEEFMGSRTLPAPLVMVRDDAMEMVTQWGLRWDSPRETAYPATYVIDTNGRVAWSKVSNSQAGRTTVEEIMKELRKL
ncbi:bacterioferritin comigratory protein (Bcp) [Rhodopirellula maiorica SM1]|uniref:Bacterioferritin comigratory protein (Bcp) n=1 Tax=Rhodopirellula maiorica SM1 TaxID=1265738 RepID=M5RJA2_9BACT|nr:redoxin family protein [Rhodopirellula maiorica]EMI15452.1 bacterioferritin comigratory protein (Bcp) [Rhodopirellula maiorica SM1]